MTEGKRVRRRVRLVDTDDRDKVIARFKTHRQAEEHLQYINDHWQEEFPHLEGHDLVIQGRRSQPFGIPTMRRARKAHQCGTCHETIRVGDAYEYSRWPAWRDYEGDVDDDGRTVAVLRNESERKWHVTRTCVPCLDKRGDPLP